MSEPPACLACGAVDPPPEMTCDGGSPGGILRDHFVGTDRGCGNCGRLVEACVIRPCSARRAVAAEADDEAWGGRGPSASYGEWLAEGRGDE